jgi:hypothetical protein
VLVLIVTPKWRRAWKLDLQHTPAPDPAGRGASIVFRLSRHAGSLFPRRNLSTGRVNLD